MSRELSKSPSNMVNRGRGLDEGFLKPLSSDETAGLSPAADSDARPSDEFRMIDAEDYQPCSWSSHCSDLDDCALESARLGPEVLLQFQLDQVYLTSTSIEWRTAPLYEGFEAELRATIDDLLNSIGKRVRYSAAPTCPCCKLPMLGEIAPASDDRQDGAAFNGHSDREIQIWTDALPFHIPGGDAAALKGHERRNVVELDDGRELEDRDEELEESAIRDQVQDCIGELFQAMQTAVWLGRLRQVQAFIDALYRLDHLLERMVDRSMAA